jgi:hypothetical protein
LNGFIKGENIAMDNEGLVSKSHDFLQHFLDETKDYTDEISGIIKATMCQFLQNTRYSLYLQAEQNGERNGDQWVSRKQIIDIQIEHLRKCIIDLQKVLYNRSIGKETLQ